MDPRHFWQVPYTDLPIYSAVPWREDHEPATWFVGYGEVPEWPSLSERLWIFGFDN